MNLSWIVDGQVAAMGMPWPEEVDELPSLGVRGVLTLSERSPDGLPRKDLAHRHVPVRDFAPPSLEQFADACAFMDEVIAKGGAVVVHCGAGLGRTGTIIAGWLVRQGWPPADAVREVRRRRPGSIETPEQEASIGLFAKTLRGDDLDAKGKA